MRLRDRLRRFATSEDGVISVNNLFVFMAACCVSAAGVDVTGLYQARSELQVAADMAAHAALFRRDHDGRTEAQAKSDAVALVEAMMPPAGYGTVLNPNDIKFGSWNAETGVFTVGGPTSAVLVTARRDSTVGNAVATYLFRVIGVGSMNVDAQTVFTTYQPACISEGFAANGIVDVQSNNGYFDGFCMHSNSHVSLNSNNYFERGTIVSMPDLTQLDIPSSGLVSNEGLREALHESYTYLHILDRIRTTATDPLYTALRTPGESERPSYINSATEVTRSISNNTSVTPASFTSGRVHVYTCNNSNRKVTFTPGTYENFILLTNCQMDLSGGATMQNMILYTTNTSATSVQVNTAGGGSQGLQLGRSDGCAAGYGAQIITRGGMKNSAKLVMNGARIVVLGDMNFAAQAVGYGSSIIADGVINGSSNMEFHGCGVPADDPFQYNYYRAAY